MNTYIEAQDGSYINLDRADMAIPFDDEKPYVLTELGKQFVHYTMNEIVPRIAGGGAADTHSPNGETDSEGFQSP